MPPKKPQPDDIVTLVIKLPRHVKEKIVRQAKNDGIGNWCTAALTEAALRKFKVVCFHEDRYRVNGWCFAPGCHVFVGEDPHGAPEEPEAVQG